MDGWTDVPIDFPCILQDIVPFGAAAQKRMRTFECDFSFPFKCVISEKVDPGDGLDNDCDGKRDEEIRDGKDNDGDGQIDEDLEMVNRLQHSLLG